MITQSSDSTPLVGDGSTTGADSCRGTNTVSGLS
jgi:hypothetical protein